MPESTDASSADMRWVGMPDHDDATLSMSLTSTTEDRAPPAAARASMSTPSFSRLALTSSSRSRSSEASSYAASPMASSFLSVTCLSVRQ